MNGTKVLIAFIATLVTVPILTYCTKSKIILPTIDHGNKTEKRTKQRGKKNKAAHHYMSTLETKIKKAWKPPKSNISDIIVAFFNVNQDGNVSQLQLLKKAESDKANQAALKAIQDSTPFAPLPPSLMTDDKKSIDIEFTFDYNVYQKSRF